MSKFESDVQIPYSVVRKTLDCLSYERTPKSGSTLLGLLVQVRTWDSLVSGL